MAEPFIGEIALVGFSYAPSGWALCNGQKLIISQNAALYSLIGNTFGMDSNPYFDLPDLRGRVPVGTSNNLQLGATGGTEQAAVPTYCLPIHTHTFYGVNAPGTKNGPGTNKTNMLANDDNTNFFDASPTISVALGENSGSFVGGNAPHNNIQPSLGLNFIIALDGIYPQ